MAYGTSNQGNKPTYGAPRATGQQAPAASTTAPAKKPAIYSTGLFAPTKEGVKSLGSVQVKETVTIPAGSYINLYEAEQKGDTSPAFRLQVTEGKIKAKA